MLQIIAALSGSIYGIALLLVPVFAIAYGASRLLRGSKVPFACAALIAVLAVLTFPSLPRLAFERNAQQQARNVPGIRLIDATRWGDLTEPMTWFYAPFGAFRFARPESPIEDIDGPVRTFRELVLRYGEEPAIYIVSVFCDDRMFMLSAPDEQGTFRNLSKHVQPLGVEEVAIFCESDWTAEHEAMRAAMLHNTSPSQ